jgi:hypothetical protein
MHAGPAGQAAYLATPALTVSKRTRVIAPNKAATPSWPPSSAARHRSRRRRHCGTPLPTQTVAPEHFPPFPDPQQPFFVAATRNSQHRRRDAGLRRAPPPAPHCGNSPAAPRPDFLLQPTQVSTLRDPSHSLGQLRSSSSRRRCPLFRRGLTGND